MRDIKFRCWNAFSNYMHQWDEMVEKNKIHLLKNENKSYVCEQYTGLKDKNGVEIYEGDIVEITTIDNFTHQPISISKEVVSFNEKTARFDNAIHFCGVCVIGNIHQNPELLGN